MSDLTSPDRVSADPWDAVEWERPPLGTVRWVADHRYGGDLSAAWRSFGFEPPAGTVPWCPEAVRFRAVPLRRWCQTEGGLVVQKRIGMGPTSGRRCALGAWLERGRYVYVEVAPDTFVVVL